MTHANPTVQQRLAASIEAEDLAELRACLDERPALVDWRIDPRRMPLTEAVRALWIEGVQELASRGAKVNPPSATHQGLRLPNPLFYVVEDDDPAALSMAEALISLGAELASLNEDGDTLMHRAAGVASGLSNLPMMRLLATRGSWGDIPNKRGMTPLMVAASLGDFEAIDILAANGADANAIIDGGTTPLTLLDGGSDDANALKCLERLLRMGADIHREDDNGCTALSMARTHELVERLLAAGADPRKANRFGASPLGLAAGRWETRTIDMAWTKAALLHERDEIEAASPPASASRPPFKAAL